jgi:hypothetical protein
MHIRELLYVHFGFAGGRSNVLGVTLCLVATVVPTIWATSKDSYCQVSSPFLVKVLPKVKGGHNQHVSIMYLLVCEAVWIASQDSVCCLLLLYLSSCRLPSRGVAM